MEQCVLRLSALDRWILVKIDNPQLAWSGSRWVPHFNGIPAGDVQVCNFSSSEEATRYAGEHGLEVDTIH